MKLKLLVILFVFIANFTFTQNEEANNHFCYQSEQTEKFLNSLSEEELNDYKKIRSEQEAFIESWVEEHGESLKNNPNRSVDYIIPVVFHIIHDGGSENISNEQVEDCINTMNEDYQLLNSDASNANPAFIGIQGDAKIEFRLAKKDPNGDCTNGITRTKSSATDDGGHNGRINAVQNEHGNWPGNRYLNVFVARSVGQGVGGYTFLPGAMGTSMANGIHVRHDAVGSIGTAGFGSSRTMTHEVGHWLDLPHTWGAGNTPGVQTNCNGDDGVADTPNTIGWQTCNVNGESCGSLDNVENYMEYSFCSKMFTEGQAARMHAALNSSVDGRNNVVSSSNLSFTGVNDPDVLCKADFQADKRQICVGQTIEFEDLSFHSPSGWEWSFPGGSPSSSTSQNPSVTYNEPGTYEVTLQATDGTSTDTETRTAFIEVLDYGASIPFMESFEHYDDIESSPWEAVEKGYSRNFEITDEFAHTGEQSVMLENFGQSSGRKYELISAPIDLSSVTDEATLTYRYAYRKRSNNNAPTLRVWFTNTCGEAWSLRNQVHSGDISDGFNNESSYWTPSSMDDWVTVHVTAVTGNFWVDDFRVKFEFESGGGNNFFLDDINVYPFGPSDLNVEEQNSLEGLSLYPNPATTEATLEYDVKNAEETQVTVIDVLGNVIQQHKIESKAGKNVVHISTIDMSAGVYMVKVNEGSADKTKRLIVK